MRENFGEKPGHEPSISDLYYACGEFLGDAVDELRLFEDIGEAIGFCSTLLVEKGARYPDEFLREKGILQ
jgi:hypothetical protein